MREGAIGRVGGAQAIELLDFSTVNKLRTTFGASAAEIEAEARAEGLKRFRDNLDDEGILEKLSQIEAVFNKFDTLSANATIANSEELTNSVLDFYQTAFDVDFALALKVERQRSQSRADEFQRQVEDLARTSLSDTLDRINQLDLSRFGSTNYQNYRDQGFSREAVGVLQAGGVIDIEPTNSEEQLLRAVSNVQEGLNSFLSGIILSTESFTEQLKNFALRLVSDLAESLLFNQLSNKAASFLTGLLDLPFAGNIPSQNSILSQGLGGGGSFTDRLFGGATSFDGTRQSGGPVSPGRIYEVNERGTEYFVPSRAGMVVPNGGGNNGAKIELNLHFYGSQNPDEIRKVVYETVLPEIEQIIIPVIQSAAQEQTALMLGN